ncbi:MAG: cobalamin-dependent protein [Acholeplasmataceae bacterium]|nr:cobalamin-dependent protein [Acholeplasmataceae bacterium]
MINNLKEMIEKKAWIALTIYEHDLSNNPQLINIKDKYIQDTLFTIRFLSISLDVEEPLIFINYMNWFGQLAYYLKFKLDSMNHHFQVCHEVFLTIFETSFFQKVNHTFKLGIKEFEASYLSTKPQGIKINEFLNFLLNMDTESAYQHVNQKIEEGSSIKDIYLKLFQPTLYQVGELWQQRIITVAKEHYITAAIQHIIGKLYPKLFLDKMSGTHSMTAVCAGDELHEIGMRMVADFFELSGWDTAFLGSNIPTELIIEHLMEYPTDLLAISANTPSQLTDVKNLIDTVKNHETLNKIKIMVGGKVFNETPNLWKLVGADGYALEPEQATLLANLLVGEQNA